MVHKSSVVAPPPLVATDEEEFGAMFDGGIPESEKLAKLYAKLAEEQGVAFFDAGTVSVASPMDGVHLDAENTRSIGEALVPVVSKLMNVN